MSGNIAVAHEIDALLDPLSKLGARCRQPDEVRGYLLEFPDLIGVIIQAVQAVRRHLLEAHLPLSES
ncbi:hypothetical protein [Thermoflexus hugenholtzii]